jgi:pleiotropic regulator 1
MESQRPAAGLQYHRTRQHVSLSHYYSLSRKEPQLILTQSSSPHLHHVVDMAETAASRPLSTAEQLIRSSSKRTREIFAADFASPSALDHASNGSFSIHPTTPAPSAAADQASVASRIRNEYEHVRDLPPALAAKMASAASTAAERRKKIKAQNAEEKASDPKMQRMIEGVSEKADKARDAQSMQLAVRAGGKGAAPNAHGPTPSRDQTSSALVRKDVVRQAKPDWHAPWKVKTVISGHMGWVSSIITLFTIVTATNFV